MKTGNITVCLLIVGSTILSCSHREAASTSTRLAKHVILIGSDGLGAYPFKNGKAQVPHMRKMMEAGSYSMEARSVLPSSSAVNWASMIMGAGPEMHGYTEWGSRTPEVPSVVTTGHGIFPTLFSLIDAQLPGEKKGVAYTWGGIGYLFEKDLVDLDYNGGSDEENRDKLIDFILREKPALAFVAFTHPDNEGHEIGHDTPAYYEAVEKIDAHVGKIVTALEENDMMDDTIIIISADHGGIGKGHGGKTLAEMEIPWVIYGKHVAGKGKLSSVIATYDTAATIAYILGLEMPQAWRGKPVYEAFEQL